MKSNIERHFIVHKLIEGQWRVNTYIDDRPELRTLLLSYQNDPANFRVTEVQIEVPVLKEWSVQLTDSKWREVCAFATKASSPENRKLFYEVASCIQSNLQEIGQS